MEVSDKFMSIPMVTRNNKGEDIKVDIMINPTMITSYYQAIHIHDNNEEIIITYICTAGRPDLLGTPLSVIQFEERLKPYLPLFVSDDNIEYEFAEIPIRYKNVKESELYGKNIWIDRVCNFNLRYITYYHPDKKIYNDEDGEVDIVWFGFATDGFQTLLPLKDFEKTVKHLNIL